MTVRTYLANFWDNINEELVCFNGYVHTDIESKIVTSTKSNILRNALGLMLPDGKFIYRNINGEFRFVNRDYFGNFERRTIQFLLSGDYVDFYTIESIYLI